MSWPRGGRSPWPSSATGRASATQFDVVDAQQQLFTAEIALAQTLRAQLVAVVQAYKTVGGGWSPEAAPAAAR